MRYSAYFFVSPSARSRISGQRSSRKRAISSFARSVNRRFRSVAETPLLFVGAARSFGACARQRGLLLRSQLALQRHTLADRGDLFAPDLLDRDRFGERAELRAARGEAFAPRVELLVQLRRRFAQLLDPAGVGAGVGLVEAQVDRQAERDGLAEAPLLAPARDDAHAAADRRPSGDAAEDDEGLAGVDPGQRRALAQLPREREDAAVRCVREPERFGDVVVATIPEHRPERVMRARSSGGIGGDRFEDGPDARAAVPRRRHGCLLLGARTRLPVASVNPALRTRRSCSPRGSSSRTCCRRSPDSARRTESTRARAPRDAPCGRRDRAAGSRRPRGSPS